MRPPDELYTLHAEVTPGDRPVLLHAFTGFLDAGSAGRLAVEGLMGSCEHRLIASFDPDETLDYRARRPRMTFLSDHFASVDVPQVALYELRDAAGTPFLLLAGPEPDYQWQRFVSAIRELVERFDVRLIVGINAVPWPAPHTRPMGATVHGNEPALLAGHSSELGALEVPGHLGGFLELLLGQAGHPSMGIAAHVPHYLVQFDYPRAAMTLVAGVAQVSGLTLPVAGFEDAARQAEAEVAEQLAGNDEFAALVRALEEQYDAAAARRTSTSGSSAPESELAPGVPSPRGRRSPPRSSASWRRWGSVPTTRDRHTPDGTHRGPVSAPPAGSRRPGPGRRGRSRTATPRSRAGSRAPRR